MPNHVRGAVARAAARELRVASCKCDSRALLRACALGTSADRYAGGDDLVYPLDAFGGAPHGAARATCKGIQGAFAKLGRVRRALH